MNNGIPTTRQPEKIVPGIWARRAWKESGWSRNRIDATFFGSSKEESPSRGTSAFWRYLACQSEIQKTYPAQTDPFLQIDSCWPGTYRYLAHPYVELLKALPSLTAVHERMVQADRQLGGVLFAGIANAMRRNYQKPADEIKALRQAWLSVRKGAHRAHFFPDMLCLVLGWIQEACLIGDIWRLKPIAGESPLSPFGLSFTHLDFLEKPFAEFLDCWLTLIICNEWERDAYRLSPMHLASQLVMNSPRAPSDPTPLDLEGLVSAVFRGEHTTELSATEQLLRARLDRETKAKLVRKVSWDRRELLAEK
jgi:hypothetical protein